MAKARVASPSSLVLQDRQWHPEVLLPPVKTGPVLNLGCRLRAHSRNNKMQLSFFMSWLLRAMVNAHLM